MKKQFYLLVVFLFLATVFTAAAPQSGDNSDNQSCSFKVVSTNTQELLNEITSLNSKLENCPVPIGAAGNLVGDGTTEVIVAMKDGSSQTIYAEIQNKKIISISNITATSKYIVNTDEESLDLILQSNNKLGAASTLYSDKKITVRGNTFFSKFKLFFFKPILGFLANRNKK